MRLYLVQHGEAISEEVDPQRPLTEKGSAEVSKMARFAQAAALEVPLIWHSGKLRARQTADLLATTLQPGEGIRERGALAPYDPIEPMLEQLEARQADLMIVGHLPFLAKLASMLLCGFLADVIAFRPTGILCLERGPDRRWRFGWMVTPELIQQGVQTPSREMRKERRAMAKGTTEAKGKKEATCPTCGRKVKEDQIRKAKKGGQKDFCYFCEEVADIGGLGPGGPRPAKK